MFKNDMLERIKFQHKDFTERVDIVDTHFADNQENMQIEVQELKKMTKENVE